MKSLGTGVVTWSYSQYRQNAEREYDDFWKALFRELLQNANDSGASQITITVPLSGDSISCIDDGCGMDLDVIQNKLLVIGGSHKGAGAVGGLGKAKELLYFSHPDWEIHTTKHTIKGKGGEYEIFENPTERQGTTVILNQTDDRIDWNEVWESAQHVMEQSHFVPKVFLNDERIKAIDALGPAVRDVDGIGTLHYKKRRNLKFIRSSYISVCVNGCWMFDRFVGDYPGKAVLNIDSNLLSPVKGLTASRDGLKRDYAVQLDGLLREIAVDTTSAFEKREPTLTLLEGNGSIDVYPSDTEIDEMVRVLQEAESVNPVDLEELGISMGEMEELALDRAAAFFKANPAEFDQVERFAHIAGYEPDFIIQEDPENDKWSHSRIKMFLPTTKASTIARVWTETVKQVLLDNNITERFVAGFLFHRNTEAMRGSDAHGRTTYFINPNFVPPTGIQNKVQFMHYMRTTAVHEVTHRFHDYHNEDFMLKYHALEAKTWNSHRIYAKIGKLR